MAKRVLGRRDSSAPAIGAFVAVSQIPVFSLSNLI